MTSPWFVVFGESSGVGFCVAVFAAVFIADVRVYAVICQTTAVQNRPTHNNPNKHVGCSVSPVDRKKHESF
jgi:hypothetical protein